MSLLANTLQPPYYAVIFSSILKEDTTEYQRVSQELEDLAKNNSGFLGFEAARNELGLFVSYWKDLESIRAWKEVSAHQLAQKKGRDQWYKSFKVRIAKIERDYEFGNELD